MPYRQPVKLAVVAIVTLAFAVPIEHRLFPAHYPPEPKINVSSVQALTDAVPGGSLTIRVMSPDGHPRTNCIAITSRDFAHWIVENGMRHTERQLIANVTIVPIDPPVPAALKNVPVAPYFDVTIPMPANLKPWKDGSFQTAALPTACPSDGQTESVENRLAAFNAAVTITDPH